MIFYRNVDNGSMKNFDSLGKQNVSKRPSSATGKTRQSPSSFDARFSQKIAKRPGPSGNNDSKRLSKSNQPSQKKLSVPLKKVSRKSVSLIKTLFSVTGFLVFAVISLNWESISPLLNMYGVSPLSLQDPVTPLAYREAGITPFQLNSGLSDETSQSIDHLQLDVTDEFSWRKYVVQPGETIIGIARKFSLTESTIIAFNNLRNARGLRAGTELKIPNIDGIPYTVRRNYTLLGIALEMKVPLNAILDANNLQNDTIRPGSALFIPGAMMDANDLSQVINPPPPAPRPSARTAHVRNADRPMIYPVPGRITSGFGWRINPVNPRLGRQLHNAIDLSGNIGDPVKAAMKGKVVVRDYNSILGNYIILEHEGYKTLYAHLSAYSVLPGDSVEQGQEIGKVGDTGYVTGSHLHFQVFRNGAAINPLVVLR